MTYAQKGERGAQKITSKLGETEGGVGAWVGVNKSQNYVDVISGSASPLTGIEWMHPMSGIKS